MSNSFGNSSVFAEGLEYKRLRRHHFQLHDLPPVKLDDVLDALSASTISQALQEIKRRRPVELRAVFERIYGTRTKSQNKRWLQRRLAEALRIRPSVHFPLTGKLPTDSCESEGVVGILAVEPSTPSVAFTDPHRFLGTCAVQQNESETESSGMIDTDLQYFPTTLTPRGSEEQSRQASTNDPVFLPSLPSFRVGITATPAFGLGNKYTSGLLDGLVPFGRCGSCLSPLYSLPATETELDITATAERTSVADIAMLSFPEPFPHEDLMSLLG